jgi:replicative DNA helicase
MDDVTQSLKVPPNSVDAEQSVLGGLLLNNEAWDQIVSIVVEDDFYRRDHRLIFRAILELIETGKPCDVVTLSERLDSQNNIDEVGGLSYLGSLVNNTPSAANIRAYADIVRERSVLRQLIWIGNEIADSAYNPGGRNSDDILEAAEKTVFEIADKGASAGNDFIDMTELLKKTVDRIDELYQQGGSFTGIPTGFNDFDKQTSGLQPADLVIIAGRPSMGKTSFAMNIAEYAAIDANVGVAVFSMEMPADSLTLRMLSSLGRINQTRVRSGQLDDDDWPRLTSAVSILNETNIFIDDTPALSPTEMRARVRRLKRKHSIGLIVVDYLQLMQVKGNTENRVNEISEISRGLKALAKEMNVPVLALSQLNRGLEQRPNKRPIMSDLRECVTGETKVVLSNGQRVPIKALVGSTPELFAIDHNRKLVVAKSDKVWCVGKRTVYKLHLAGGQSIRATAEHRFMIDLSWKKVSEIKIGSKIALAGKLPELEQIVDLADCSDQPIHPQVNNDLYWDNVISIEEGGEEEVYDLSVPGYENWLADGIVSHNSGAIEQDADVIVFIYRDEVYNEDSPDKGTAEIIIGKQRNGPLGTSRLTFLGQYTRFENHASIEYDEY